MTTKRALPTEQEALGYAKTCSNWGRWGSDDQLGTLNLITEEKRRQAASLVKEGVSVSCAWPITSDTPGEHFSKVLHYMIEAGEAYGPGSEGELGEPQWSLDFIGLAYHGNSITHMDALCHVFSQGKMYNGLPSSMVSAANGATAESIELAHKTIVTRGVLLDIPRLRGVQWLEPGTAILPEDLEEAEKAEGVRVEAGDVLLVRTGHLERHYNAGPLEDVAASNAGTHVACVPWFRERDIAVLGSDCDNEVNPSGYKKLNPPIHCIAIPYMGLWLLDNANLGDLAEACAQHNRWEFMLTIAPLRIKYGTGSPVNPLAVF